MQYLHLQVYGRELLIYDVDGFTRIWLKDQLGLLPHELTPIPVDFSTGPKRPPMQVISCFQGPMQM